MQSVQMVGQLAGDLGNTARSTRKMSNAHISQFVLQLDLHKPIYDKKGSATKLPFQKFDQISAGLVHTCAVGQTSNPQSEHEKMQL